MKRLTFLSAVIAMVLVVTAVSCTPAREVAGEDDYYYNDRTQAPARIYVDDPYRGTVVLEKDPYTGRYYEVNSYGYYSSPYGYRGNRYNNYYGSNYKNRSRTYYNHPRTYSNESSRQAEEQKKNQEKKAEDRRRILGS